MANQPKNKTSENIDAAQGAPKSRTIAPALKRFWYDLQTKYYIKKHSFINFLPDTSADNYWRWHIDLPAYKSPFKEKDRDRVVLSRKQRENFIGNDDLKVIFQSQLEVSKVIWMKLEEIIQPKGFFLPEKEIIHLKKNQLEPYLIYGKLMNESFQFVPYLEAIKTQVNLPVLMDVPLPIIACWQYVQFYAKFLKDISTKKHKEFKVIQQILAISIPLADFEKKLPSQQILDLLKSEFQLQYVDGMTAGKQKDLVQKASLEVRFFWKKYADSLRFIIKHGYLAITKRTMGSRKVIYTGKETGIQFFKLFTKELEQVKIQELLDNHLGGNYYQDLSENIRLKYGKDKEYNIEKQLKDAIGGKSILDRIKESAEKKTIEPQAHFTPDNEPWIKEESPKWYELSEEEQGELLRAVNDDLSLFARQKLEKDAQKRWNLYLQKFASQLLAPFLFWEVVEYPSEEVVVPKWNLLRGKRAFDLAKKFEETELKEVKERIILNSALKGLSAQKAIEDILNYETTIKPFSSEYIQQKWKTALTEKKLAIEHRQKYRFRRMLEFGMLEVGEYPNKKQELWLDEMLQIEKEIGPYVPFVKKAFLMALPSRTSVEFDPYRHSHDGIEFDPETTQDQHKWMRGEVMKSLRSRTGKSDAEQINAFVLDFSGSMRHKKMRNLFKMLYLMVLGLEDRKSYDAFHFFGTEFIETVNFSDLYTNRSLLFKILKQITRIDYEGIRFGGRGGTNIGAGVIECHKRIKEFAKTKKAKNPKVFYLKSIFVITDGEPSIGIHIPEKLNEEIKRRRADGSIAIKGIYLKPKEEEYVSFMDRIFGEDQYVETDDFAEAINQLVYIMTKTYKQQRKDLKQQKIKEKYERSRRQFK